MCGSWVAEFILSICTIERKPKNPLRHLIDKKTKATRLNLKENQWKNRLRRLIKGRNSNPKDIRFRAWMSRSSRCALPKADKFTKGSFSKENCTQKLLRMRVICPQTATSLSIKTQLLSSWTCSMCGLRPNYKIIQFKGSSLREVTRALKGSMHLGGTA